MLRDISLMSAEAGAIFQTHVNEHLVAIERSLVARGLRPLEHLDAVGALGPQTLIAHATLLTPPEIATCCAGPTRRWPTIPWRRCGRATPSRRQS